MRYENVQIENEWMIFYNKKLDITKCKMNKAECLKAAFFLSFIPFNY